jgi:hypothetical protein
LLEMTGMALPRNMQKARYLTSTLSTSDLLAQKFIKLNLHAGVPDL